MAKSPFQSPEVWKSALLTLPDNSYFELLRSVFGNVKTPFNKQRLAEDLAAFISRKETQEIIALYIDETDARIIAAIATLEEPVSVELETFFAGEFSYAELHSILVNLEERLILYRFSDKDLRGQEIRRISLNPLLEPVLAPVIADKGSLFPSQPLDAPALAAPALDDRILAALFAFVACEPEFFKGEGGIRKKVLEDFRGIFPGQSLETLAGGLQGLGLLEQSGEGGAGGLVPDEAKLRAFRDLSYVDRREYLAAGICIDRSSPKSKDGTAREGMPPLLPYTRGRLQSLVRFIHTLLNVMRTDRQYPKSTLSRIADVLERGGIAPVSRRMSPYGGNETGGTRLSSPGVFDTILEALQTVGLLSATAEERYVRYSPADADEALPADTGGDAVIAMDTAFSCILYPEIRFADALDLASFSLVRETGATVRFEMTRESVVRGFDRGMNAGAILALLDRLSGNQVEQNLRFTVKDWETRYTAVSLYQGLVLTLAEDRRYLAEAEPVASLISRTLAPGIYLLAGSLRADAIEALQRAGIDIIAQPPSPLPVDLSGERYAPYPSLASMQRYYSFGLQAKPGEDLFPEADTELPSRNMEQAEQHKERFRTALGKLSLTKAERDELSARIDRRLILNESQLVGGSVRYEKLEARGLDYVGKTSIAKQAITAKQLIEITWSSPDGRVNRAVGIPEALEKAGGETVLVLKSGDASDAVRLPLGKIGLLRRIKQSIFGE